MSAQKKQFTGFFLPNSTQVPDILFDDLMADLSGAELKTLLYIIRRTFGFKKRSDKISINQMLSGIKKKNGEILDRGTGLSKPALLKSLKKLKEQNIIIPTKQFDEKGGYSPTEYRLNVEHFQNNSDGEEKDPSKESLPTPLGKKSLLGVVNKINQPLVKKVALQGTVKQDTVNNTVNVNKNGKKNIQNLPNIIEQEEKADYLSQTIIEQLKDQHSLNFYKLVSRKIPETIIRQFLSEIKSDGAKNPAKLFTYKITKYADEKISQIKIQQFTKQKENLFKNINIIKQNPNERSE